MSPEAQRIAIATTCGWKTELCDGDHQRCQNGMCYPSRFCTDIIPVWWVENSERYPGVYANPPDYLNDLNAMHEAEKVFCSDGKQSERYAESILDVLQVPLAFIGTARCAFLTNHATAAQRAEAFLRTLNLEKEAADV